MAEKNSGNVEGMTDVRFDLSAVVIDRCWCGETSYISKDFILVDGEGLKSVWETGLNFCASFVTVTVCC